MLTPAEVRVLREGLGVTAEWLAAHVGVQTRAVQRWESGARAINPAAVEALLVLEQRAADQVAERVEAFRGALAPVLSLEDGGGGDWPAGWLRMVAFRVRQEVPALRVVPSP